MEDKKENPMKRSSIELSVGTLSTRLPNLRRFFPSLAGLLLLVSGTLLIHPPTEAQATGLVVGKECLLSWTPPTTATDGSFLAGPLAVTQAGVYITTTATAPVQGTPTAVLLPVGGVIPQQWGCAGVTPGQHWAWVSYSNVNGEGALSTSLPFVLSTAIPNGPSGLTVK